MYAIDADRLADIELSWGPHASRDSGMCLLEAAAYLAGEDHSDSPQCVSRLLGTVGRVIHDATPDSRRQDLKQLIPSLLGTRWDGLDYIRFRMVRFRCAEKHLGDLLPRTPEGEVLAKELAAVVDGRDSEALDELLVRVRTEFLPGGWREMGLPHHSWRLRLENCLAGLGDNIIGFTSQFAGVDLPVAFLDEDAHNECISFLADLITAAH